ncbi:zinc finger CCCH-type with G patch domain-containing protein isoform X2 [Protopterus annectens]|uniref:zinc finger CCCH-type with G patch domain-containing protein isoform X2 n=1 Tax=Protopterus annectens TaxID=7888 RepID=UPI001CFABED3|nr:zinc finger CCCH-type with G patch domain-containing protein isoform X2 [Protopterus annectens]
MDEDNLKAAIDAYAEQLCQVNATLEAGLDQTQHADLLKLQDDLKQLIELTESSLLCVRKSKNLANLEEDSLSTITDCQMQAKNEVFDDEYAAFQAAIAELNDDSAENSDFRNETSHLDGDNLKKNIDHVENDSSTDGKVEDELHGMKVRAPYHSAWGTLEYHNAMIVEAYSSEDGDGKVRVLYLYPTHKSMKACPFFLEGKCRFKENCRFSHGEVVLVSELQPFKGPDLSSLEVGSACLAKHEDGLWYSAKIKDIDSGYYTVKFDSRLLKESVVEGDAVIPPLRGKELSSSSSESDEEGIDDSAYAKVLDPSSSGSCDWNPSCSSSFGSWEAHTRGIGSKLMAKMGYEFGKGLGRNAEGQVEPVLAIILPRGKSLDQCAKLLQKTQGELQQQKCKKHKLKNKASSSAHTESRHSTVFDFLNEKLSAGWNSHAPQSSQTCASENNRKETCQATKDSTRALNIQLLQTTEKIEKLKKDIGSIQEALARNVGRKEGFENFEESIHKYSELPLDKKRLILELMEVVLDNNFIIFEGTRP